MRWVFCGGMRRAGSTVQYQMTAHIVEQAGMGQRVGFVRPAEYPALRERLADEPGWKVFKSHACTPEITAELQAGRAKGVYIYRDIRDVMLSLVRKTSKDGEDPDEVFTRLMQAGMIDVLLRDDAQWRSLPNVLISRYEHAIRHLSEEAGRIAAHLDIPLDAATCDAIGAQFSLDKQKARIQQGDFVRQNRQRFDAHSMLHPDHIRSGVAGEWRDHFSREQVMWIERQAGDWLRANEYVLSGYRPSTYTRLKAKIRAGWDRLQKRTP